MHRGAAPHLENHLRQVTGTEHHLQVKNDPESHLLDQDQKQLHPGGLNLHWEKKVRTGLGSLQQGGKENARRACLNSEREFFKSKI